MWGSAARGSLILDDRAAEAQKWERKLDSVGLWWVAEPHKWGWG